MQTVEERTTVRSKVTFGDNVVVEEDEVVVVQW